MKYTKLLGPIMLLGLFIFSMSSTVFAIPLKTVEAFPENYETRINHRELIFGSKNDIFSFESAVYPQNGDGANVSMQVLRQNDSFYLLFTNQEGVDYPIYSRGSYIIKRNDASGAFEQIKIFIRSEPGSFVRILPDGSRSTMDVFLMDVPIFKNVILPITLEQLSVEPFSRIVEATRYQVDWTIIAQQQQRQGDREIKGIVDTLRPLLASLKDSDDGALDADGTFKFIDDLTQNLESGFNCSGFAKWVVDGLYLPRTGESLPIELLKVKHLDSRGNEWSRRYEDERDPYFGLDWSRNLATAIMALDSPDSSGIESADVRQVPFFDYFEDVGYRIDDLELILFLLTRLEPGFFYIGSVNREFGTDPVLKQHVHVAILFPYLDDKGDFHVSVMERNLETSLKSLNYRYSGDHIHLVRVAASDSFSPPLVEF